MVESAASTSSARRKRKEEKRARRRAEQEAAKSADERRPSKKQKRAPPAEGASIVETPTTAIVSDGIPRIDDYLEAKRARKARRKEKHQLRLQQEEERRLKQAQVTHGCRANACPRCLFMLLRASMVL